MENKKPLDAIHDIIVNKKKQSSSIANLIEENVELHEKVKVLDILLVDYDSFKKKVDNLGTCLLKFTNSKKNLDKLFGSQRIPCTRIV